jgi:hypothetical protein
MVKAMAGTLPWAALLAVTGGAIWWLLSRDMTAGRWLLAAVLIGHGVVHVFFAVPAPKAADNATAWPFDMAQSWAVTRPGFDLNTVRLMGLVLIAVTIVAFALAALATADVIVPAGWWQPIVALGTIASAAMLVLFMEPQLVVGLGIDAVLLWVVATRAWAP